MKNRFLVILCMIIFLAVYSIGCVKNNIGEQFDTGTNLSKTDAVKIEDILIIDGNDTEIEYVIGYNTWNGAKFDRLDTWTIYQEEIGLEAVPNIKSENIQIDFLHEMPDTLTIYCYPLDASGEKEDLTQDLASLEVVFQTDGKTVAFDYDADSMTEDSEYLGFIMYCLWGDNNCEFVFLVKPD